MIKLKDNNLKITILAENTVYQSGLMAEHGLSLFLEYNGKKYLFDTGQGMVLEDNAEKLDIDLKNLDGLFLSHGHYDHTGGLKKLLEINPEIKVYAHPAAFAEKYSQKEKIYFAGYDGKKPENFISVENKLEIAEDLFLTGEITAENDDYLNKKFKVKKNGEFVTDRFLDDISLYLETAEGLIIILGCSHKGVENIIKNIIELSSCKKIKAVIGGMHLKNASEEKINSKAEFFAELDIDNIYPIHCTGRKAQFIFQKKLSDKVKLAGVGDIIKF